jgi:hypothetical protein
LPRRVSLGEYLSLCLSVSLLTSLLCQVHSLELASDGPRRGLEAVLDGIPEEAEDAKIYGPISSPIRAIYYTRHERHLLVGTDSGEIRIFAQDSEYLRQRLERKLAEIGIL